ncbi:MAG TPA: hypothetical protein P5181_09600 [Dermatophilaceae bacterium]|nr:hypothetical protein [Dermatophilaceae bacterium]
MTVGRGGSVAPAAEELERLVGRWRQLPLDQALRYAARVRAVAEQLLAKAEPARAPAAEPAPAPGVESTVRLADLGPVTALDQLRVAVHDALAAGVADGEIAGLLTRLRAELR